MTLQLSLDERLKGALVRHTFATQTPFRLNWHRLWARCLSRCWQG